MNKNRKNKEFNQKKTAEKHSGIVIIVSALWTWGLLILGAVLSKTVFADLPKESFGVVAGISAALPPLVLLLLTVLGRIYSGKHKTEKVKDAIAFLNDKREHAQKTSDAELPVLGNIRAAVYALAVFLILCASFVSFFMGAAGANSSLYFPAFILCEACLVTGALAFLPRPLPSEPEADDSVLPEQEYPRLYAIAEKAKNALGIDGKTLLAIDGGANVGIYRLKKHVVLLLGMMTVKEMSDEELYAVMLHEFAHLNEDPKGKKAAAFAERMNVVLSSTPITGTLGFFYSFPLSAYFFHYSLYSFAVSILKEQEADRAMTLCGDPEDAASALILLFFHDRYEWESDAKDLPFRFYEGEEPPRDAFSREAKVFEDAVKERGEAWIGMIDREILPRSSTHPTVKMRLEALGVTSYSARRKSPGAELSAEYERILSRIDSDLYKNSRENYSSARQEHYLEPTERIERWKAEGEPLVAEEYRSILDAMLKLGNREDAERLCDRAIETLPDSAAPTAYLFKGGQLLRRYDPAGVDLIYKAIEENSNNIETGLLLIGQFCCYTGNSALLENYRERATELAQFKKDKYDETGILRKSDDLSAEHLPDGVLEAFISYVKGFENGGIDRIYLVHKQITPDFFTSAFIIKYAGDLRPEERSKISDRIFEYLDTVSDWQYSLFDYDNVSSVKPERIEGSCVYEKDRA